MHVEWWLVLAALISVLTKDTVTIKMDGDLYDEFGNYIGPEIESDESSEGDENEDRNVEDEVCTLLMQTIDIELL